MQITIPFKTPTINHLYLRRGYHSFLTKEARELQKQIAMILSDTTFEFLEQKLKVSVDIYENWYYQNGSVATKDISNREKFLIDAVFKALELDDKYIFEHILRKVQSDEEKAIINIEEL